MQRFDNVTGIFCPRRRDDLKPAAVALIGQRLNLQVAWEIDEGEYAGEWALMAATGETLAGTSPLPGGMWIPSGDVQEVS